MDMESLYADVCTEAKNKSKIILRDHSDMIYRLALSQLKNKTDAEDIFQDVFVKYIKSNKVFESNEHIKAWLIRVTVNCCKNFRRMAWFRYTVPLEDWEGSLTSDGGHEKSDVYYAVMELPLKYRTIIHLLSVYWG